MFQISHEAAIAFFSLVCVLVGGLITWRMSAQKKLNSIESKSVVISATLKNDMKYLTNDVTDLKKNSIDHDRRIQRLEDSAPNLGVQG